MNCNCSHNNNSQNAINKDKDNDTLLEKEANEDLSNKLANGSNSMLKNIKRHELSEEKGESIEYSCCN